MNLNTYYQLAWRTAKTFINMEMNLVHAALGLTSEAGELSEFIMHTKLNKAKKNGTLAEELGDIYWFLAYASGLLMARGGFVPPSVHELILGGSSKFLLYIDAQGVPEGKVVDISEDLQAWRTSAFYVQPVDEAVLSLAAACGQYATLVKSEVVYHKNVTPLAYYNALLVIGKTLNIVLQILRISFEEVAIANIEKLKKRYPEKYSDEAAIARADKNEHTADELPQADSDGGTPD